MDHLLVTCGRTRSGQCHGTPTHTPLSVYLRAGAAPGCLLRGGGAKCLPSAARAPKKGDCPPQEVFFHFASRFTEERTKIAKSDNDVYEGSCVLSPCTNL